MNKTYRPMTPAELRNMEVAALKKNPNKPPLTFYRLTANKATNFLCVTWAALWIFLFYFGAIKYTTLLILLMVISFAWSLRRAIGHGEISK